MNFLPSPLPTYVLSFCFSFQSILLTCELGSFYLNRVFVNNLITRNVNKLEEQCSIQTKENLYPGRLVNIFKLLIETNDLQLILTDIFRKSLLEDFLKLYRIKNHKELKLNLWSMYPAHTLTYWIFLCLFHGYGSGSGFGRIRMIFPDPALY